MWQITFNKELGFIPKLYRFPYGSNNKYIFIPNDKNCIVRLATNILEEMGIVYIDWNVTSGDGTKEAGADEIYENVIKGMDSQKIPIVLLHEWNDNTLLVLDKILEYGKKQGYRFEALDENVKVQQLVK